MTPGALPAVVAASGSNTGVSVASFSIVVAADALVRGDVADGDDLVVEAAGILGCRGALVRAGGPRILVLARDLEVTGNGGGLLIMWSLSKVEVSPSKTMWSRISLSPIR